MVNGDLGRAPMPTCIFCNCIQGIITDTGIYRERGVCKVSCTFPAKAKNGVIFLYRTRRKQLTKGGPLLTLFQIKSTHLYLAYTGQQVRYYLRCGSNCIGLSL